MIPAFSAPANQIQQQLLEQVRGVMTTTYVAPSIVEHADFDKAACLATSIFRRPTVPVIVTPRMSTPHSGQRE